MTKILITQEESDNIMNEKKYINEEIKWMKKPQHGMIYEFTVPIELGFNNKIRLTLIVNRNTKIRKFTFTILYNGTVRIKSLDIGKGHKNPPFRKEDQVGKTHKHTWTDQWRDTWAYKPDDITEGADFHQLLQEFFLECNIKCLVEIPEIPSIKEELILDDELFKGNGIY